MATSPSNMIEESANNKENIVLRTLVGDPNRHTPMVEHRPPSMYSIENQEPSAMYVIETRNQPIPAKALPKSTDPKIYYFDSNQMLERESPIPVNGVPTVFLEPKVMSQPIFYSISDRNTPPITSEPTQRESFEPTVYAITGRPRRPTVDMSVNNTDIPTPRIDDTATVYSLVGNPRLQNSIEETPRKLPTKSTQPIIQPSPNLYSIVGNPARTSRGVQVSPLNGQRPAPVIYTIVGGTPPEDTNRIVEKPPKKQLTNTVVYSINQPINYTAKPEQIQESFRKPTTYTLVNKPVAPQTQSNQKKYESSPRKRTPPPQSIIVNRRISRSLEHKPEVIKEEIISYPVVQSTHQSPSKESRFPKSEVLHISTNQQDNKPVRSKIPPISEQTNHKPYVIAHDQPIQLPDYHSPYAIRTHKPFRERKFTTKPLPTITHTHIERKSRPPLYEPRYRVEKHHPYVPIKPTSSERYPVMAKTHSSYWDNGYQTQTDDDEEYEKRLNKKKHNYKTPRPRAPWIPIW